MEITEFLPTREVDPVYFERSYYLGPGKGGDRAYKLLTEALTKSERSALAKYASRGKQYLVLLRPVGGKLVMQQLRYADEVRAVAEVPVGEAEVKPGELALALQIVEQAVSEHFDPEKYEDEVRQRVMDLVQQKIAGQEITAEPTEAPQAQVIDLMEALKASLAAKGVERMPAKSAEPRRAARKTASKGGAKKQTGSS
jgi:DNA end-binding protein Ku